VVKVGTLFSAFVVLTLLILLAPAVILLPGENVVQGNPLLPRTEEVEASFSFSEVLNGSWGGFTAGTNDINGYIALHGVTLEQFTREHVVRTGQLSGCEFRNYTTGSGTVSGDLSGSISLAWNTFKFNDAYPYTPKYNATATDFGFMVGKGLIDEGSGNFTFIFLADFDSDDDMTNANGKGVMVSIDESGTYGSDPDPAERHKIIGDFEINKTGANYAGNFHLRNYPPEEVFDLSVLNVMGAVRIDDRDPIGKNLSVVNITVDTPMYTPTDHPTGFEEINWGKDPPKTVTAGHLGANGTMDISRNSVLYLEFPILPNGTHAHIEGTSACNLLINDTYAQTGDDGTSHGLLYQFLLLSIPESYTPVTIPTQFGHQWGYTWMQFGMFYQSTESYAGIESFALANISLEAVVFDPTQYSADWAYGLFPHPKVESVTPSSGYLGETLNVVIKGKYFLKAGPDAPGSSWSLGPGITVNSWSLKNSSPIDNEIQACITINPGAATTTRDANVTACFHHENATLRQYMSGELASAFTVKALENATLQGNVTFIGRGDPGTKWIESAKVALYAAGGTPTDVNHLWKGSAIVNTTGFFLISNLTPGDYDIGIKNWTGLSVLATNVTLSSIAAVDFGEIKQGDCKNDDDKVTLKDRILMYALWGTSDPRGCFKRDGDVGLNDRILMYGYWDNVGDLGFPL